MRKQAFHLCGNKDSDQLINGFDFAAQSDSKILSWLNLNSSF